MADELNPLAVVIHLVSVALRIALAAAAERVHRLVDNLVASEVVSRDEAIALLRRMDRGQLGALFAVNPGEQVGVMRALVFPDTDDAPPA